jgi:hypothetical protein
MFDEFAKRHQGDVDFVAERVATLGGAHLEPLQGYRRAHGATPFPTGKRGELRLVRVVQAYLHYCAGSREAIESSAKEPAPPGFPYRHHAGSLAREPGQRSVTERWWHLHSAMSSFTRCWTQTSSRRTVSGARSTNNNAWYAANA